MKRKISYRPLLTPCETRIMLGVGEKTLSRWADKGKLQSVRTPGNHRRFYEDEVRALLAGGGGTR